MNRGFYRCSLINTILPKVTYVIDFGSILYGISFAWLSFGVEFTVKKGSTGGGGDDDGEPNIILHNLNCISKAA